MLDYQLNDLEEDGQAAAGGLGIATEVAKGGTVNDAKAGASATSLLGKTGIFGGNTSGIESGAGIASSALGIYTGIEKGGAEGDISAAANAGKLYSQVSTAMEAAGGGGLAGASAIGEVAGPLAAGLAVYEFASQWKSGDTGGDAIRGAEAGAAVGSVIPVVGTIAGAVIGGAIGAVSSIFGPGKQDPESAVWDQYAAAYQKNGAAGVSGATPSQNFQLLAGIFDSRPGAGADAIPFYAKYGRMGEASFTSDMTNTINSALAKGTITKNTPPAQIYSSVVLPWINSMEPGKTMAGVGNTSKGVPTSGAMQNMLTTMIGQYQSGQLTNTSKLGVSGQTIPQLQAFGAMGAPPNTAQITQTVNTAASTFNAGVGAAPFTTSMKTPASAGGTGASTAATATSPSAALASLALVSPALFSGDSSKMAITNNTQTGTGGAAAAQGAGASTTGGDPNSGATGTPVATPGTDPTDSSASSSILSDVGSFLGSNLGGIAEAGTLGALGLSEANSQKKTNAELAASLSSQGTQATALGGAIDTQLTGGKAVAGPLGASITQQTDAAAALGNIANEYATGTTTPAQDQQLADYAAQQKAMVDSQLAASGNLDSSARQAAYQQIDNNVATMKQNLIAGNTAMATQALTSVQQTYSTLLNQSLSESSFGFQTQEAAVQLQIQSDTALSGQLQTLFAGIAKGFGNSTGSSAGSTAGKVAGAIGKAVSGSGSSGVASSAGGAVNDQDLENQVNDDPTASNAVNADLEGGASDPFSTDGSSDISDFWNSSASDTTLDFGGNPFGDDSDGG